MYLRAAKAAGMNDAEMKAVVDHLSMAPDDGALMEGTGGARKLRAAGRGKGKSGGYRIVTYYCGKDVPVFLLDIYSKGDKTNLTKAERSTLREILAEVANTWRESARRKAQELRRNDHD
jgi:hypothetical protein